MSNPRVHLTAVARLGQSSLDEEFTILDDVSLDSFMSYCDSHSLHRTSRSQFTWAGNFEKSKPAVRVLETGFEW